MQFLRVSLFRLHTCMFRLFFVFRIDKNYAYDVKIYHGLSLTEIGLVQRFRIAQGYVALRLHRPKNLELSAVKTQNYELKLGKN